MKTSPLVLLSYFFLFGTFIFHCLSHLSWRQKSWQVACQRKKWAFYGMSLALFSVFANSISLRLPAGEEWDFPCASGHFMIAALLCAVISLVLVVRMMRRSFGVKERYEVYNNSFRLAFLAYLLFHAVIVEARCWRSAEVFQSFNFSAVFLFFSHVIGVIAVFVTLYGVVRRGFDFNYPVNWKVLVNVWQFASAILLVSLIWFADGNMNFVHAAGVIFFILGFIQHYRKKFFRQSNDVSESWEIDSLWCYIYSFIISIIAWGNLVLT